MCCIFPSIPYTIQNRHSELYKKAAMFITQIKEITTYTEWHTMTLKVSWHFEYGFSSRFVKKKELDNFGWPIFDFAKKWPHKLKMIHDPVT